MRSLNLGLESRCGFPVTKRLNPLPSAPTGRHQGHLWWVPVFAPAGGRNQCGERSNRAAQCRGSLGRQEFVEAVEELGKNDDWASFGHFVVVRSTARRRAVSKIRLRSPLGGSPGSVTSRFRTSVARSFGRHLIKFIRTDGLAPLRTTHVHRTNE
ncbi:MAG: hypothetical protein ACI8TP_003058 [Acidimicrobiales bacterium]|jgi:hypothetical protein